MSVSELEKLEAGDIDFDTAFAAITEADAKKVSNVSTEQVAGAIPIKRNATGKVVLQSAASICFDHSIATERSSISLKSIKNLNAPSAVSTFTTPAPKSATPVEHSPEQQKIATPSKSSVINVVSYVVNAKGIAVVCMKDEAHRNMFSTDIMAGLRDVFEEINGRDDIKVLIIHGYGNWFSCGSTPEMLDAIRRGQMSFMDDDFFTCLLTCSVPTIAAMQGHALGGGMTFGLYADLLVLAEHSYYAANFMDHGFTPGVGATYLFPHKFGMVLGHEMLLTGKSYKGIELKERSAPMTIVPNADVISHAMMLAESLAEKPTLQLKTFKAHLSVPIYDAVHGVFPKEDAMHETVFSAMRDKKN